MAVTVIRTQNSATLRFRYHAWVVEQIKARIPSPYRAWDPDAREWEVDEPYVDAAIGLLRQVFSNVSIIDERWPKSEQATQDPDGHYRTLHLLPTAPTELIEVAYRCLARLYHPDVGGDTARMQALNLAYTHLKARAA